MLSLRRRLLPVLLLLILIVILGTVGFWILEPLRFIDAFYMTIIMLTTVGFGDVVPVTDAGRLFSVTLLTGGIMLFAYTSGVAGEYLLTVGITDVLRRRRMRKAIEDLDHHVIICGYGRVGENAAFMFQETGQPFVIIDNDNAALEAAWERGWVALEGDATKDEVLVQAGIDRAWGILVCTGSDVDNLFIVLSARTLQPKLYIVTRSSEMGNEAKLRRAGADKVVSPYQIGGRHMANSILRPHVTEFLDVVTLDSGLELWLEELLIYDKSELLGKTVGDAHIRNRTGVTLVAVRRAVDGVTMTPNSDTRLHVGDELIVLGTREQLTSLEKLAGKPAGVRRHHPHPRFDGG